MKVILFLSGIFLTFPQIATAQYQELKSGTTKSSEDSRLIVGTTQWSGYKCKIVDENRRIVEVPYHKLNTVDGCGNENNPNVKAAYGVTDSKGKVAISDSSPIFDWYNEGKLRIWRSRDGTVMLLMDLERATGLYTSSFCKGDDLILACTCSTEVSCQCGDDDSEDDYYRDSVRVDLDKKTGRLHVVRQYFNRNSFSGPVGIITSEINFQKPTDSERRGWRIKDRTIYAFDLLTLGLYSGCGGGGGI